MDDIKYTEEQKYALECVKHLRDELNRIDSNYILIGLLLREAKNYYKNIPDTKYKNLYDFAKKELDICSTTAKYLVQVNERFCNGMQLKDKYKQFKYTQLREMASLNNEQLDLCLPSMTVNEIKALKKRGVVNEDIVLNKYIKSPIAYEEVYFKNKDERQVFLDTYRTWELFKEIPEFTLRFFRVKLTDDTYLIATESEYNYSQVYGEYYCKDKTRVEKSVKYTILNQKDKYSRYLIDGISKTTLVDHLSKNKLGYYKVVQNDD